MSNSAQPAASALLQRPAQGVKFPVDWKTQPSYEAGLEHWRQSVGQLGGGAMALALGEGAREGIAEDIEKLLRPVTGIMERLGYSPYGAAHKQLQRTLMLRHPGLTPERYEQIFSQLMHGPYETPTGVLKPEAGGWKLGDRAKAYHTLVRMGLNPTPADLSQYLKATGAVAERGQGGIAASGQQLQQMFSLRSVPKELWERTARTMMIRDMLANG